MVFGNRSSPHRPSGSSAAVVAMTAMDPVRVPSSTSKSASHRVYELFHSSAENQCCADCTSPLDDSVWASITVGAFLCIHCAGAHRKLGVQFSRIKSLHLDTWGEEDVMGMDGGNKRVHAIYDKFLHRWMAMDPSTALLPSAEAEARERYIRAKYEALKFTALPNTKVDSQTELKKIVVAIQVSGSQEEKSRQLTPELAEESPPSSVSTPPKITPPSSSSRTSPPLESTASTVNSSGTQRREAGGTEPKRQQEQSRHPPGNGNKATRTVVEVSKRFLQHFIVVGRGGLAPDQNLGNSQGPTDLQFEPMVLDQYPEELDDSPVPAHLAQFAFPEGYELSQFYIQPTFFSFVLTNMSGVKIYACALKFYEELHPLEIVSLLAPCYRPSRRRRHQANDSDNNGTSGNPNGDLPAWVQDLTSVSPGPVFSPKCILVTSYYPYISAFRQFLQQTYRITLSDAPMPIERYITNFVSEIPLPPQGQIQVQLTLPDRNLTLSRPPRNDYPLVDFSFRPLFQALDINNVLQVFTCAVLEYKIVLCSKHIAMLTPVAETILAILLPFAWQGAYIPVLPSSLLDVIDAPVPFIVGTHSDSMTQATAQASGVVFVDLDHNRVVPAVDEYGMTISIPKLPEREGAKLRVKLSQSANIFDPYAAGLSKVNLAFPNDEHLEPIGMFGYEHGHTVPLPKSVSETSISDSISSLYSISKSKRGGRKLSCTQISSPGSMSNLTASASSPMHSSSRSGVTMSQSRMSYSTSSASGMPSLAPPPHDGMGGLMDSSFNEADDFSTSDIRKAFLRFFVTLFKKYASYLNTSAAPGIKATDALFDADTFLRDTCDSSSRQFMSRLIATQMFDRFVEDRVFHGTLPEVRFFDQSINQKLNRSLKLGKKKHDCSFLDDRSDEIRETFIAPPPSNLGLPDDGTVYSYKSFPRLKSALFGTVRTPRVLFTTSEHQRNVTPVELHHRIFTMTKWMKGSTSSWEDTRRLITQIQSQYRGFSARSKYMKQRQSAILIQRHVVARIKGARGRTAFLQTRQATVTIQARWRMYTTRRQYLVKRQAAVALQFFAFGVITACRYQRMRRGMRRLQAQWRSSFHKCSYKNLKYQVIRVQSRVRGLLSRRRTMRWKEDMFTNLRRKIFDLWEQCNVPLLHRSKFWLTFNRPDFFNIGVYHEEERRLLVCCQETHFARDAYEYSTQPQPGAAQKSNRIRSATRTMMHSLSNRTKRSHPDGHLFIADVATIRVKQERQLLYDALKRQTTASVRIAFFKQLGIAVDSKNKKRRLASLVWTSFGEASSSAEIVVTVSCSSDRQHPLPAQIDRHKQIRIREDLAFTVNAALKSIRYTSYPSAPGMSPPPHKDRELLELQHQVRMLATQNRRLSSELMAAQRESSRLQMELQLQTQPCLRRALIINEQPSPSPSPAPSPPPPAL